MTSEQQALLEQDARYHERRSKDFGVGGGVPQMHAAIAKAISAALVLRAVVKEYQDAAKTDDDVRFSAAAEAVLDYPLSPAVADGTPEKCAKCDTPTSCDEYGCRKPTPPPAVPIGEPTFLTGETLAELDPGVRDVVNGLNVAGFRTTDSGDGCSKAAAISVGEALPFRHVACVVSREAMFREADRLLAVLGAGWTVEASYHPPDGPCLLFASESGPDTVTVPRGEWDALQAEVEKARLTHERSRP